jgi:predicted metal-dependent hydrolase
MTLFRWFVRRTRRSASRGAYLRDRESARSLIAGRLAHWRGVRVFPVGSVRIKNHRSQWGSCSNRNNLNFNYRLLYLPGHLADYVVVHELCHTLEHNHSPQFWAHVASLLPDWRARRVALRAFHPAVNARVATPFTSGGRGV